MGELNPNATSVQMVKYTYQGNPVNFSIDGNVMVSATNMAKSFGKYKQPSNWLRTDQAQEFLTELSKVRNFTLDSKPHICGLADLVQIKKGGMNPGTWFHEDVALEFARWLSPSFAIWCNDRIKEILLSQVNGGTLPVIRQAPPAIDTTEKDREIAKWKSCYEESFEIVKSMHKSNEIMRSSMNQNSNMLYDFMKNYIYPDNRLTHVPPQVFEFIMNLGKTIQSQQETIDYFMKGGAL